MPITVTENELFHFTKFENLLSIIENGFYPRFNQEYTLLSDIFKRPAHLAAVPMICFCDLPLYLTREHSEKYSRCAIGLTKDWAIRNRLSPVIYVHPNSILGDAQAALVNALSPYHSSKTNGNMELVQIFTLALKGLNHLSCFLKPYERVIDEEIQIGDKLFRFKKGRFYDEREWRYVPFDKHGDLMLINYSDLLNVEKMREHNAKLIAHRLTFEFDDVAYILFENDDQRNVILELLSDKYKLSTEEILNKDILRQIDTCYNVDRIETIS